MIKTCEDCDIAIGGSVRRKVCSECRIKRGNASAGLSYKKSRGKTKPKLFLDYQRDADHKDNYRDGTPRSRPLRTIEIEALYKMVDDMAKKIHSLEVRLHAYENSDFPAQAVMAPGKLKQLKR